MKRKLRMDPRGRRLTTSPRIFFHRDRRCKPRQSRIVLSKVMAKSSCRRVLRFDWSPSDESFFDDFAIPLPVRECHHLLSVRVHLFLERFLTGVLLAPDLQEDLAERSATGGCIPDSLAAQKSLETDGMPPFTVCGSCCQGPWYASGQSPPPGQLGPSE